MVFLSSHTFIFPDVLNKMVRVGCNKHISAGFTSGEGKEHLLWENGNYHEFGEYPVTSYSPEKRFFHNGKHTAGITDKDKIWDFYIYQNLVRSYDLHGNLLENIKIVNRNKNTRKTNNQDSEINFWGLHCNSSYIVTSYNEAFSKNEFYSHSDKQREIQLWTWDGTLKRRIHFNVPFGLYTISEDNILYAMCTGQPNIIYSYNLNEN